MKRVPLLSVLIFTLIGCSAALVPYTSDPARKLDQAYALMDQDRPLAAEALIVAAQQIYEERRDDLGMAEADYAYGNLCKTDIYHQFPRVSKRLCSTKADAAVYFKKALEMYAKHSDFIGAAKSYYGIANVYEMTGRRSDACRNYGDSLSSYNKARRLDPSAEMPFRSHAMDFREVIDFAKQRVGCNTVNGELGTSITK